MKSELKRIRMTEFMMSARDFAKYLNVEYTTYKNWENELNQPTLETAYMVATKLKRSVESIWHY